jgi:hypothetical protein
MREVNWWVSGSPAARYVANLTQADLAQFLRKEKAAFCGFGKDRSLAGFLN